MSVRFGRSRALVVNTERERLARYLRKTKVPPGYCIVFRLAAHLFLSDLEERVDHLMLDSVRKNGSQSNLR
jgi:hypothetical protein